MSTMSYLSRFILLTASMPSWATSKVHPAICRSFDATMRQVASSSTSSTLGGTDHDGTKVWRTTRIEFEARGDDGSAGVSRRRSMPSVVTVSGSAPVPLRRLSSSMALTDDSDSCGYVALPIDSNEADAAYDGSSAGDHIAGVDEKADIGMPADGTPTLPEYGMEAGDIEGSSAPCCGD